MTPMVLPVDPSWTKFRRLALAAALVTFIVIVLGGVVRSTGSEGCQGWPACSGSWLLPSDPAVLVDYLHRVSTLVLVGLFAALAWDTWRSYRSHLNLSLPVFGSVALLGVQVLLGARVALAAGSLERSPLTAVHLGLSLLVQALALVPVVAGYYLPEGPQPGRALRLFGNNHSPFARLTGWTLAAVFILLVSGAMVSGAGAETACTSWPLCDGSLIPSTSAGWINMAHRLVVALTGLLVGLLLVKAWRTQRTQTPILVAATSAGVLFFAQALLGALKVAQNYPLYMLGLHEASSVAVWGSMIVLAVAVITANRTAEDERLEASAFTGRPVKTLLVDFLKLTKPIVVVLLLVTTFAGMVIGAKAWPSFSLVFWTLLGGFMASGGSGAINQYIDRFDDLKMQRTEKRPIPAGRLTPAEGLAFGVGIALASFFLMVAFVNLLAALLSLAGIIYYVLIYSILLKKTTVQNIVIGGGAGAIPPLVGWAAATGGLNIPSLFLFAVVFMWTPPHFWALALVRRKDYARAGVPMLPVVRGEAETRWQIFIYTVELVALTLLLPLFGLGGSLYLVLAGVLGLLLLASAWRVWRGEGNKTAWKMYRHSSMYLAFLFLALMIDALVIG